MGSLAGKRIVVFGGSSGIGFAVAKGALAEGARVTIASSGEDKLADALERLGGGDAVRIDVTDEAQVADYFANAGTIDHIAFTAGDWGKVRRSDFAELDLEALRTLFNVRFWGALAVAKHGARHIAPGGSITLTNGMSAHRPEKGSATATGMAGGVEHLAIGLAVELAPLRVNCVCPGAIRTEIWAMLPDNLREGQETRLSRQLIPRVGEPGEVAEAYLYLMKAGYTTGQVLRVEGGWTFSS